jgi:hypothetical protein
MSSTVTTSTVTTVTSVTSVTTVALALSLALGLILSLTLLFLLIQKEILTASPGSRAQAMSRVLNVAIAPLLLSFFFIASYTIYTVIQVVR